MPPCQKSFVKTGHPYLDRCTDLTKHLFSGLICREIFSARNIDLRNKWFSWITEAACFLPHFPEICIQSRSHSSLQTASSAWVLLTAGFALNYCQWAGLSELLFCAQISVKFCTCASSHPWTWSHPDAQRTSNKTSTSEHTSCPRMWPFPLLCLPQLCFRLPGHPQSLARHIIGCYTFHFWYIFKSFLHRQVHSSFRAPAVSCLRVCITLQTHLCVFLGLAFCPLSPPIHSSHSNKKILWEIRYDNALLCSNLWMNDSLILT